MYAGARWPVNIDRASVTRRRKGDKATVAEVLPLLTFVMAFAKEQSLMTLGTYGERGIIGQTRSCHRIFSRCPIGHVLQRLSTRCTALENTPRGYMDCTLSLHDRDFLVASSHIFIQHQGQQEYKPEWQVNLLCTAVFIIEVWRSQMQP